MKIETRASSEEQDDSDADIIEKESDKTWNLEPLKRPKKKKEKSMQ